ncbi:MAG TPA: hypothetical protein QKA14_01615, partial [Candidatus Megaira endosymbiont of Hartmannula sinica]|nr:hypothetical protein [Candidatus Megaera endosymbiont of Hartmannula sinica]
CDIHNIINILNKYDINIINNHKGNLVKDNNNQVNIHNRILFNLKKLGLFLKNIKLNSKLSDISLSYLNHDDLKNNVNIRKILLSYLNDCNIDNKKLIKEIIFTIPVLKKVEKILLIPHIYKSRDYVVFHKEMNPKFIFRSEFVSRFSHFLNF